MVQQSEVKWRWGKGKGKDYTTLHNHERRRRQQKRGARKQWRPRWDKRTGWHGSPGRRRWRKCSRKRKELQKSPHAHSGHRHSNVCDKHTHSRSTIIRQRSGRRSRIEPKDSVPNWRQRYCCWWCWWCLTPLSLFFFFLLFSASIDTSKM